jgi:hypothetical protein
MTRPTLSPEMLLWEVTAMCSRHGLPVSTDNPGAALHHAEGLMRALGLTLPTEQLAIEAPHEPATSTAVLPLVPADEPHLPPSTFMLPPRRPLDGHSFDRGRHRPGAPRSLQVVADDGA